jgi:hypothetical protein
MFKRKPCTYCSGYRNHTSSNCPSEQARADRRKRAAHWRRVRKLIAQSAAQNTTDN